MVRFLKSVCCVTWPVKDYSLTTVLTASLWICGQVTEHSVISFSNLNNYWQFWTHFQKNIFFITLDWKLAIQILMQISMLLSVSKETKIKLEFLCKRQNILYNLYFLTRNLKKIVIKITCAGVKELFTMFILEFSCKFCLGKKLVF